eukprot:gene19528-biopygen5508
MPTPPSSVTCPKVTPRSKTSPWGVWACWEKRLRTRTGRGRDAGRTIEFKETDAGRTREGYVQRRFPGLVAGCIDVDAVLRRCLYSPVLVFSGQVRGCFVLDSADKPYEQFQDQVATDTGTLIGKSLSGMSDLNSSPRRPHHKQGKIQGEPVDV